MIQTIYIIILSYFMLGSIAFYFINRKKEREVALKSRTKFITYFVIINILFFSIVINPIAFQFISVLIIGFGFFELIKLYRNSGADKKAFFTISMLIFSVFSTGFLFFATLDRELILFTFLILSIFDSFSQITGQLWGRKRVVPKISPNKTVGGIIGGATIAFISSIMLNELYPAPLIKIVLLTAGIILFAFVGDIAASLFKRKYGVKDYSNLIPGHGGFLDRFDSLIAGGAWAALSVLVLNF